MNFCLKLAIFWANILFQSAHSENKELLCREARNSHLSERQKSTLWGRLSLPLCLCHNLPLTVLLWLWELHSRLASPALEGCKNQSAPISASQYMLMWNARKALCTVWASLYLTAEAVNHTQKHVVMANDLALSANKSRGFSSCLTG